MEPAEIQNEQFRELLENFINFLRKKCYKERPINKYRRILAGIDLYMQENGIDGYDPDVGRSYYDYIAASGTRHFRIVETRTAVRRLNDYCLGAEYKVRKSYHTTYTLPEDCEHAIRSYEQYCRDIGNKEKTVSDKRRMLRTFLTNCPACGNDGLNGLTVSSVTGACFKLKNKDAWAVVRSFLKFLFTRGIVAADYSTSIPHYKREFKLPASYTTEEIQKIEVAVDRNTATGKRDYAMLLFATRLGMRSGDIVLLRMDNIDFLHKNISFVQQKTGVELCLPLLQEIEAALLDYIHNARPATDEDRIFLRHNAPYFPATTALLRSETKKYFKAAGINTEGKKRGLHVFRASLATSMVNDDVPYEIIRGILGHADPDSINHYAKLDIERLRTCAVAVPEPTGAFKEFLEGGCGI